MGLNNAPSSERVHIGIYGKRNAGKSTLMNMLTNQNISIVSDVKGTTTDPVLKSMELLPIGAVVIIDTSGIDDVGKLGEQRVDKTYQMLNKTDIAIVVIDKDIASDEDKELIKKIKEKGIPFLICHNRMDNDSEATILQDDSKIYHIYGSVKMQDTVNKVKECLGNINIHKEPQRKLVADLIKAKDFVLLVTPIDESAPKGRIILPQQQVIRDILDANAMPILTKETELEETLNRLGEKPSLVICDSQVFGIVDRIVPKDIKLTSFSILMARYKGNFKQAVQSLQVLDNMKDGDKILISEGCTHHRQCNDIGTVKLPKWIKEYTNKELEFEFTSGTEFKTDIEKYSLIIHCGACMLNEQEIKYRYKYAKEKNIPMVNYGMAIAYVNGIIKRSLEVFGEI